MILLPCPWCGPRNVQEFHQVGEVLTRPDVPTTTPEQWRDYLFFRDNPQGRTTEQWYHRAGCRRYFVAERDTVTNEVHTTRRPARQRADAEAHAPQPADDRSEEESR